MLTLGESKRARECRAYVGGLTGGDVRGLTLGCNLYAPKRRSIRRRRHGYGSLFVGSVAASASTTMHYDMRHPERRLGMCAPGSCDDGNPCTTDACGPRRVHPHPGLQRDTVHGNQPLRQNVHVPVGDLRRIEPRRLRVAPTRATSAGDMQSGDGHVHQPPVSNGTPATTTTYASPVTCAERQCAAALPSPVPRRDHCTTVGACNPATGQCSNPPVANGTPCSTETLCSTADTCQSGTCTNGAPVVCTASGPCTTPGTCNPATGACTNPQAPNGTPCSTGNLCPGDTCKAGACTNGTPVVCTASGPCTAPGVCNPTTGVCTNPALRTGRRARPGTSASAEIRVSPARAPTARRSSAPPAAPAPSGHLQSLDRNLQQSDASRMGTACTTGNACFTGDTCVSGTCANGTPVTCTASDQCHVAGRAIPRAAHARTRRREWHACNDGNACTTGDACGRHMRRDTGDLHRARLCAIRRGRATPPRDCSNPVIPGCDVNPVQASGLRAERLDDRPGRRHQRRPVTDYSLSVYDAPATGSPRSDLVFTTAGDGSFRARLTQFPTSEPAHSPPHHEMLRIESMTTSRPSRRLHAPGRRGGPRGHHGDDPRLQHDHHRSRRGALSSTRSTASSSTSRRAP